jgi:hypothetical protein
LQAKVSKYPIIIGLIIVALGIIFKLQGESVIGPSSSFMYNDPIWSLNGYILVAIGLGLIVSGAAIGYYYRSRT